MKKVNITLVVLLNSIKGLFDQGYRENVLFAGDLARQSYWICYEGRPGLAFMVTQLDERLMELGLTRQMLDQIWTANPKLLFA